MKSGLKILLLSVVACVVSALDAEACATCFGKTDAPMARGMNMGIMVLLGVIGTVLAGVVSFFVYVAKRTAAHEARQAMEDGSNDSPTDSF